MLKKSTMRGAPAALFVLLFSLTAHAAPAHPEDCVVSPAPQPKVSSKILVPGGSQVDIPLTPAARGAEPDAFGGTTIKVRKSDGVEKVISTPECPVPGQSE